MANPYYNDGAELFLDILTKEEKEALLTKKMEAIRKKNDSIRIRHEVYEANGHQNKPEIQADKWTSVSPNHKVIETGPGPLPARQQPDMPQRGSQSPRKETRPLNGEEIRQFDHSDRSEIPREKAPNIDHRTWQTAR